MWFKRERKNRRLKRGHVLDVKLRSDRVNAARTKMVSLALGVTFGTVFGLYLLWRTGEWALDKFIYDNSAFAIQSIEVQTDGVIAPEQLRRWTRVRIGANLIALDMASVKRNLQLVSTIDSVSVERVLPHTLKVRVTERSPVAQVNVPTTGASGGIAVSVFQVDVNGYVMQPLDPRLSTIPLAQMTEELPVITGLNVYQLQPGHRIESPQVQAALELIGAFEHSPMAGLVNLRRVDVSQPGVVIATTGQGSEITFALDQLEQQLARWRKIYDWGQTMSKTIASADLAVSNNVPVRWMAATVVPAAPRKIPTPPNPGGEMFDESNIIVGLEIGTSKICAVVGEQGEDGALNVVGLGQARSRGVRKGEIADATMVEEDVRNAIVEAEQMADVEIRSVYLGVTGGHIRGFNNRGVHPVVSADREISKDDVSDVIKNAKAINLPAENTIIHAVRQHFLVDGHGGITDPVGMLGARIEVDMHVVHGNTNRLQNAIRMVKGLQLKVDEIVSCGLASSLALLTSEQKELGALVIDIGAGTTNYVVYADGVIKHTGVLAVGGDHVSNDLGHGLKVPLSRAEKLKLEHGSALVDAAVAGQTVTILNELGLPLKTINLEHLQRIMSLRLEEIFQIIASDLESAGLTDYLRAGVFLCGGGARVPQMARLAERILQMPVSIGQTNSISGLKSALDQPEFVTAIGLAKFGSLKSRGNGGKKSIVSTLTNFWRR